MEEYFKKNQWKFLLILFAFCIGCISVLYTNYVIKKIKIEEKKRAKLWAEALRKEVQTEDSDFLSFLLDVLGEHTAVPAIIVDQNDQLVYANGLDSTKTFKKEEKGKFYDMDYFTGQLLEMKAKSIPFEIDLGHGKKWYVYYKDSLLLTELKYFPYVQLSIILVFIIVAYFAFNRSRESEQNLVWVGMAKETAHQLGTPISALFAWADYLRERYKEDTIVAEIENDIKRLQIITDRFSKIGSVPVLEVHNVFDVISNYVQYFKIRISKNISFEVEGFQTFSKISIPLFEWVIENLFKNAVNAMPSVGQIHVQISTQKKKIFIDIHDTGKGIPKLKWETIFEPGYTTRKRGWGLGLSLSRRIIENYHKGELYVLHSEIGKGTTFRIELTAMMQP